MSRQTLTLTLVFFFLAQWGYGQEFSELIEVQPLKGVSHSSVAFADVDGDGDEDLLITGEVWGGRWDVGITKLYLNDGSGNFSEKEDATFENLRYSSVAFADVDGDGDLDVLLSGLDNNGFYGSARLILYFNDGSGNFTFNGVFWKGVWNSKITFSDVDGDGDQDFLVTGSERFNDGIYITRLYFNDGQGNFTDNGSRQFDDVAFGTSAIADIDGDAKEDILILAQKYLLPNSSVFYMNKGGGNFVKQNEMPFEKLASSVVAFSDVDQDGDQDMMIAGENDSTQAITKLYLNDGQGGFSEKQSVPFEGVTLGSIDFSDMDSDGDEDVLITGRSDTLGTISKYYLNDGTGNFVEGTVTSFDGVQESDVAFSDIDGDGDDDVLITGKSRSATNVSFLYLNEGGEVFRRILTKPLERVVSGETAFADVDGDGDQDMLVTGMNIVGKFVGELYLNDGTGHFQENLEAPFAGIWTSSLAFEDIDQDGDLDLLITGQEEAPNSHSGISSARLYLNDGQGNFTEKADTPFRRTASGSVVFGDIDGDSDLDVVISGGGFSNVKTELYLNEGGANFSEANDTLFTGVSKSSIAFSDIDGDGDKDLFITGEGALDFTTFTSPIISELYLNDGTGQFSLIENTPFEPIIGGIAFSDVDGDGDEDVFITGENEALNPVSKLYLNDGTGTFTQKLGTPFINLYFSSVVFSDVDVDGDEDIILSGWDRSLRNRTVLYLNEGNGNFALHTNTPFVGVRSGAVVCADVDGDGVEDVLVSGYQLDRTPIAKLYINEAILTSVETPANDKESIFAFNVYPNPSKDSYITLDFFVETGFPTKVSFYDLSGRLLFMHEEMLGIGKQSIQLEIPDLPRGAYLVELSSNTRRGAKLFMVQ